MDFFLSDAASAEYIMNSSFFLNPRLSLFGCSSARRVIIVCGNFFFFGWMDTLPLSGLISCRFL